MRNRFAHVHKYPKRFLWLYLLLQVPSSSWGRAPRSRETEVPTVYTYGTNAVVARLMACVESFIEFMLADRGLWCTSILADTRSQYFLHQETHSLILAQIRDAQTSQTIFDTL